MRTGKDRVQVDAEQVSVNIGDARVMPGDILLGDSDGVVVIPQSREDEVLTVAEDINSVEEKILALLKNGSRLDEARQKLSYHSLQTPEE